METRTPTDDRHSGASLVDAATDIDMNGMSDDVNQTTNRCYLLEIAPELRLQIYEHVFGPTTHLFTCYRISNDEVWCHRIPRLWMRDCVGLLMSCRTVEKEATPVLWDHLQISLVCGWKPLWFHPKEGSRSMPVRHMVRNMRRFGFCFAHDGTVSETIGDLEAWAAQLEQHRSNGVTVGPSCFLETCMYFPLSDGESDEDEDGDDGAENDGIGVPVEDASTAWLARRLGRAVMERAQEHILQAADGSVTFAVWKSIEKALMHPASDSQLDDVFESV